MSLPVTLHNNSPATSDTPVASQVSIHAANMEDLLGIADNVPIAAALTTCTTSGLIAVNFQNAGADPAAAGVLNRNGTLLRYHDGTVVQRVILWPSGTVTLFRNATAPTGWTRVVDATKTDSVPRLLLNGEALADGGSWTISGLSGDSHVLTTTEIPAHNHGVTDPGHVHSAGTEAFVITGAGTITTGGGAGGSMPTTSSNTTGITTNNTGGGGGHTHTISSTGAWRPLHVDCIAASLT